MSRGLLKRGFKGTVCIPAHCIDLMQTAEGRKILKDVQQQSNANLLWLNFNDQYDPPLLETVGFDAPTQVACDHANNLLEEYFRNTLRSVSIESTDSIPTTATRVSCNCICTSSKCF